MAASLEFRGLDTLVGVLQNARTNAPPAVAAAMYDVMVKVFNESQKQVPVATGTLKASGHLEGPDVVNGHVELSIGYGGAAAEYAVWVHENLSARHRPPTKAKYLEDPMTEHAGDLDAIAAKGDMEQAILRQYPQSPARAHAADMATETARGYRGMSPARRRSAASRATPFSTADIGAALRNASAHRGRMIRKGR